MADTIPSSRLRAVGDALAVGLAGGLVAARLLSPWLPLSSSHGFLRRRFPVNAPFDAARRVKHPVRDGWEARLPVELEHTSGYVTTAHGRLYWQALRRKDAPPTRAVALLHGYGDHCDFALFNTAARLALGAGDGGGEGVLALLIDLPGHGRSDGVHGLISSWETYMAALTEALEKWALPHARHALGDPAATLTLFGSSMGGATALTAALALGPDVVGGVALVAPMVEIPNLPPVAVRAVLTGLAWLLPALPLVPRGNHNAKCYRDAATADEAGALNALAYGAPTRLRTATQLLRACDGLDEKLPQLECRLLIMHGTADEMTDFKGSLKLFGIAGSKDKELHLYKDCLHGLHYGECAAVCASVERDIARFVHGAEPVTTVIEHAESNGWEGEVKY